jgi:hypothetical protein
MAKFYFILDLFINVKTLFVPTVIVSPCSLESKSKKARNITIEVISSLFKRENN